MTNNPLVHVKRIEAIENCPEDRVGEILGFPVIVDDEVPDDEIWLCTPTHKIVITGFETPDDEK